MPDERAQRRALRPRRHRAAQRHQGTRGGNEHERPAERPKQAVTTAIAEYNPIAAVLAELTKRHKGVVFDVTQPSGMKAAKAAAKDIGQYRIALEKKRKDLKEDVLVRGRLIDGEAKRIADQLAALEDPIVDQIKAEERRIEAERQAAIEAEQRRLAEEERLRKEAEERRIAEERAKLAPSARPSRSSSAPPGEAEAEERVRREAEEKAPGAPAEEDRLAAERRKVEEERAALEREKLAKELAEKRAIEEAAAKKRAPRKRPRAARQGRGASARSARRRQAAERAQPSSAPRRSSWTRAPCSPLAPRSPARSCRASAPRGHLRRRHAAQQRGLRARAPAGRLQRHLGRREGLGRQGRRRPAVAHSTSSCSSRT
jgi:hypothetical protein